MNAEHAQTSALRDIGPAECDLCADVLPLEHAHAVDLEAQSLTCICTSCAGLFQNAVEKRFRTVPKDVRREAEFTAVDAWRALGPPAGVAFCFYASTVRRWRAVLPGPAGATETELDDARWRALRDGSSLVRELAPDVEALLVRFQPGRPAQAFAAPIDRCYALAGILCRSWNGFDGGDGVRAATEAFFADLTAQSRVVAS